MNDFEELEVWFVTGSQHLYGDEVLDKVADNSQEIAESLTKEDDMPVNIVFKSVLTTASEIKKLVREANAAENCIGLITWMHTFSPSRMWIHGLKSLEKPFVHLHTQFNEQIPWPKIDMDFMNTNQSAHGGREFGFAVSRMRVNRKVIVGHWKDDKVINKLGTWIRAASAWHDAQGAKIARFGDNMRRVAVTEGDKVAAEIKFGCSVNGYGIGDLVGYVNNIRPQKIDNTIAQYEEEYQLASKLQADGKQRESLREAARIELGLRAFLEDGNFKGFTTTFENLHGLKQLPGLAVQRLMADGYGFGAEGDWKTAMLLRAMKVMDVGLEGGTSFMEQYTYDLSPDDKKVLGAHMLEICETIADEQPTLEIQPLDIGGKADPVRSVFNAESGSALNASLIDLGNRFRMIVNEVEAVKPDKSLPNLPVARAVWKPKPNFETAISAWIHAGGAHHTGFSQSLTVDHLQDFAEMADIEFLTIDESTELTEFKKELKWNETHYQIENL